MMRERAGKEVKERQWEEDMGERERESGKEWKRRRRAGREKADSWERESGKERKEKADRKWERTQKVCRVCAYLNNLLVPSAK